VFHVKQSDNLTGSTNPESPHWDKALRHPRADDGLNMETIVCPACNSQESMPEISCRDHLVSKSMFHVKHCPVCGLRYTNPRPNKLIINNYYVSSDYISHSEGGRSLLERVYRIARGRMLKRKLNMLKTYLPDGGSILDVGCGTGSFLLYANQHGYHTKGFEPQEHARNIALNKGLDVAAVEAELDITPGQSLQGVTLWHVLEHIHELKPRLQFINRVLAPGGTLFVAVPITNSLDAVYYGQHWAAWDLPRHLYHFDRDTIINLLEKYGFTCVGHRGLPYDSFYVSLLSEKYKSSLPQGLRQIRALIIGLLSNLYAVAGFRPWSSEVFVFRKKE
jgi:SAM-dependent methyltransferase